MTGAALVLAILGCAILGWYGWGWASDRYALAEVAAELGLRIGGGGLRGALEGVPLQLDPPTGERGWSLRAGIASPLPQGLRIIGEAGSVLLRGSSADLALLLRNPSVERAVGNRIEAGCSLEIADAVRVTAPAEMFEPISEFALRAVLLARAVDGAQGAIVADLSRALGQGPDAFSLGDAVEGQVDGVRVRARRPVAVVGGWELSLSGWVGEQRVDRTVTEGALDPVARVRELVDELRGR